MRISLTSLGIAALAAATSPLILGSYQLGTGKSYVPDSTDLDIHGTVVTSGTPALPEVISANVVRYSVFLDLNSGPYSFGELGLYLPSGDLFALACGDSDIVKLPMSGTLVIDCYVSAVSGAFTAWIDLGDNKELRLANISTVDLLPQSKDAVPNIYAVTGASSSQSTFMAYTDRNGLWVFDTYKYATTIGSNSTIISSDTQSITLNISDYDADNWVNPYYGSLIVEFASGALYSVCRYVESIIVTSTEFTLVFSTPLLIQPLAGDKILRFKREPLSVNQLILPPATTSEIGGVIVGSGLTVDATGLLEVDPLAIPGGVVQSVNNQQGEVELDVSDIPGAVASVNGNLPDSDGNVNVSSYTLPVASATVLGGVRIADSNLLIDNITGELSLGFSPVSNVNGQTGVVTIEGLIDPTDILTSADLNNYTDVGLFYCSTNGLAATLVNAPPDAGIGILEVMPLGGTNIIQRWSQASGSTYERRILQGVAESWTLVGGVDTVPVADSTTLGKVRIGEGLNIESDGELSSLLLTVNNKAPDASGNIVIDSTDITIPVASDTDLGGVIVGDGLTVDSNGLLEAVIRGVNGIEPDENGIVIISGEDLGMVPLEYIGAPNGVAGPLDAAPVDPDDPDAELTPEEEAYNLYTYSRLPEDQLPLGALVYVADWDASLNEIDSTAYPNTILASNGILQNTEDLVDLPANGKVFRVSVSGSTLLDGISEWVVGDLVLAIGDRWYRISNNQSSPTMTEVTVTSGATVNLVVPPTITDPISAQVLLKVKDVVTDTWYDGFAAGALAYTSTDVTLTNSYSSDLTFRYRFIKG